jgi:hypothetical protein
MVCENLTKPMFKKRLCICLGDLVDYEVKGVSREYKGKDGGLWRIGRNVKWLVLIFITWMFIIFIGIPAYIIKRIKNGR